MCDLELTSRRSMHLGQAECQPKGVHERERILAFDQSLSPLRSFFGSAFPILKCIRSRFLDLGALQVGNGRDLISW